MTYSCDRRRRFIARAVGDEAANWGPQPKLIERPTSVIQRAPDEAIFLNEEALLKQGRPSFPPSTKGSSVMWALIEELYRDYCLTRLNEIRRYALTR